MSSHAAEFNAGLEGLFEQLATLAEDSSAAGVGPDQDPAATARLPRHAPVRDDEMPTQEANGVAAAEETFLPAAPASVAETHVAQGEIEGIILRLLMFRGTAAGVAISQQIGLSFALTEKVLYALKADAVEIAEDADYVEFVRAVLPATITAATLVGVYGPAKAPLPSAA